MSLFQSLLERINNSLKNDQHSLSINGVDSDLFSFINAIAHNTSCHYSSNSKIIVFPTSDDAESHYNNNKKYFSQSFSKKFNYLHFPGLDASPYSGIYSSEKSLFFRFRVLNAILENDKPNIIITSIDALALNLPPVNFFNDTKLVLNISDIISPIDLAKKLVGIGYTSSHTIEEAASFSRKGEIFDIYPINHTPIRIHYFDDMIEDIFSIDKDTYKTIKDEKFESISIAAAPAIFCDSTYSNALRDNVLKATPGQKIKFEYRKDIFSKLSNGMLFDNYAVYSPLFFQDTSNLFDFINPEKDFLIFIDRHSSEDSITDYYENLRVDYEDYLVNDQSALLPEYDRLFSTDLFKRINSFSQININNLNIQRHFEEEEASTSIDMAIEKSNQYFVKHLDSPGTKQEFLKNILNFIKSEFDQTGHVIFTTQNSNSKDEIKHILDMLNFPPGLLKRISFIDFKLPHGFYYNNEKTLVVSDADLFAVKKDIIKVKKESNYDLFAQQLASLKPGDYIIHSKHGVGQYQGLEAMDVGESKTDYLVLTFKDNDKIFVPIYKMNLIQKYAEATASLALDSLRTNKFAATKARAKDGVKKLAFDLLKLQAERQSTQAFSFSPPDHEFHEFELDFPFNETPDQTLAIESVLEKMQSTVPMDFLVCGDVGFGKTEVAMRAAYKAVLDKKQVAILVPTTVLALQHFNSFKKRFKNFAVNVDFLSRFKKGKEEKETKERLKNGEIDIIIGTHKLLSDTIKFKDLGLVVVDEEQRFGVGHKSKLQLLKSSVDFLTLTATPIPRTLQLSFLGLKDLALIKTAPPRRQSIKTYLIKEDDHTLQMAIKRELKRGGQVFIVHNRVNDMENYVAHIRDLAPEARIVFAHGQLPENELEARVSAFYNGAYDILVSTTIIESGIDIPNANTMIVDRADRYGLSQLHQLRGRIGRSDKKAYAYFVIPNGRAINEIAEKRLKALQTYADMGSGFQIANCDLEIRGAGDILGGQQSGHIEAIGLELYMELLTEAILELRGEKKLVHKDIEINTPFASFIPNHYVTDASERLKFYKQLSNARSESEIKDSEEKFYDIYGPLPDELNNLFAILYSRVQLFSLGLKSVQVMDNSIVLTFEKSIIESNDSLRNQIIDAFINRTKKYKFTPDFKLIYSHKEKVTPSFLVNYCKEIAQQIVPC